MCTRNRLINLYSEYRFFYIICCILFINKIISNAQAISDETTIIQELQKGKTNGKYLPQLRSFALTLNFYSPKAYNYI